LKRKPWAALCLCFACAVISILSTLAYAQKFDLAAGVSTIEAPGASNGNGSDHQPVTLSGGAYVGVSGDVRVFHHISLGGEGFWRATQAQNYNGQGFNYRPIFWNVNAVYGPKIATHTYLELVAGVGALSTHYYVGSYCGIYESVGCFHSYNHLDGDFGAGIRFYPRSGGWFIRPEARVYLINNNFDFSANYATRIGASIGYTFGRH
jgi:hypothetical protein